MLLKYNNQSIVPEAIKVSNNEESNNGIEKTPDNIVKEDDNDSVPQSEDKNQILAFKLESLIKILMQQTIN